MKIKFSFLIYLLLCFFTHATAQDVLINEALGSNTNYFDEDGDASDWFELYNNSDHDFNLKDWSVTDDIDVIDKWMIPEYNLSADSYLFLWASGKDRSELSYARNYIKQNDVVRYILPASSVDNNWVNTDFDDSSWASGIIGIGYGDGDDATPIPQGTRSVFLRKTFSVSDVNNIEELILDIDYDDGFVAYINGVEVARSFMSGNPPGYNAFANSNHEALMYNGDLAERYYIANPQEIIQNGNNVLAIQAHNVSSTSSDFSIIPFLSAVFENQSRDGNEVPNVLDLSANFYHTNFKLSAGNETIYLFDPIGQMIDSLALKTERPNISMGREVASERIVFFQKTTPGLQNSSTSFEGVLDAEINFSHEGGPSGILDLELSSDRTDGEIRYSINSIIPNENSFEYSVPIPITQNIVIRARYFKEGFIPSKTFSRSFLTDASHDLPIISLITDRNNFFGSEGIYIRGQNAEFDFPFFGSNFWEDWERPVHFSFYDEEGNLGELTDAGIKIFGGWSRGFDQKSFSLFARKEYGSGKFKFPFFEELDYSSFEALVLRNSGNDWGRTHMRDATLTSLLTGADLEFQAYQPTVLYVNGNYWGIYNLREKINEHFVASKKGVDPDDVTILELDGVVIKGDNTEYEELINYVATQNLATESSYQYVSDRVDIDNFALYYASQIYFDNQDWPGNNIKYWKTSNGKWRWVLFDTDFGFGIWDRNNYVNNTLAFALASNGPGWPNPPWSTLLFRQLNKNEKFVHIFINQMADAMNSRFKPDRVNAVIDKHKEQISSEVSDHFNRWNLNFQFWAGNIQNMRNWGNRRPGVVKQLIKSQYEIEDFHPLTIRNNNPLAGYVIINDRINVDEGIWQGDYFQDVPIELTAIPFSGSVFSHWEGDINSTEATISVNVNRKFEIKAIFKLEEFVIFPVVINEINYKSSPEFDTDDWIELYNSADVPINLTDWSVQDADDNRYTFPIGIEIASNDYLVLAKDVDQFNLLLPSVNAIGDLGFGLSSKGDRISLFDQAELLQDEVEYDNSEPWPEEADGKGFTLELITPDLDNMLAENWSTINETGSPGRANTETTSVIDLNSSGLLSIYPIPATDRLFIDLDLTKKSYVDIKLISINGKSIVPIVQEPAEVGKQSFVLDLDLFPNGIYKIIANINGQVYSESISKM